MKLDEAIKHCLEVAEKNETLSEWGERNKVSCLECAANHRQLAEWLTDYKELRNQRAEYKRLLRLAVEDINAAEACDTCEYYPVINGTECQKDDCYKWRHADEALALIGEEGGNNA